METAIYSFLHFLVDFLCAHAMFLRFLSGPEHYAGILIYNFCAFALQMPLGAVMDLHGDRRRLPAAAAGLGVALTILGSFTHPAVLGLGNALFHVGGGIGVIREDHCRNWKGRGLGVFVAPGALGLFLGGQLSVDITFILASMMLLMTVPLFRLPQGDLVIPERSRKQNALIPLLCCFLVVILRSYVGLAVVFPWKTGFGMGLAAVCAVVLGKVAGGFSAVRFGTRNTVFASLALAAICYLFCDQPFFGILALFFFNMTMPVTLYELALRFPELPGFCFGLLTFGLFLGFLPVALGWNLPVGGVRGSLLSLGLLLPVVWRERK